MQTIHGEKKIEEAIKKQLDSEKQKFRKRTKGREAKFLFVLLESLNYLVGGRLLIERDGLIDRIDITNFRLITALRAMLDIILQSRMSTVQMVNNDEFFEVLSILREHVRIGLLSHMLYVQNTSPVKEIKVDDGVILEVQDEDLTYFYQAFQSWGNVAGVDSNWINWFFGSKKFQEKRAKVGTLLRRGFEKTYRLKMDDLTNISTYFQRASEEHLKKTKWSASSTPFLYIKRKTLQREFSKHMTQRDSQEWFKLLEYRPGRDLLKSPLIPVKFRSIKVYTLMTWVFTPSNSFWSAWTTDLLLDHLKLSARGKLADQYGKAFQSYVDEKLDESKLPITNLGSRKISAYDYPEIRPWLNKLANKEGFEVDRLIKCDKVLFVISCKARDFLYDRKVVRRDLFFSKEELERRVTQDLRDMSEIYTIADCIESCNEMRKRLKISAGRFVPVLLTSMKEPLSCSEVRSYYSKRRGVKLPKVHIATISQFIEDIRNRVML